MIQATSNLRDVNQIRTRAVYGWNAITNDKGYFD
jgi:hypothetical protein